MSRNDFNQTNILTDYASKIKMADLRGLRKKAATALSRPYWEEFFSLLGQIPDLSALGQEAKLDFKGGAVRIGSSGMLEDLKPEIISSAVKALIPWRKGPFELFGEFIDAEWRSNLKWDRIAPHLGDLRGKRIADVGCNNGYYMFRLSQFDPELVVGLDPSERCCLQFQLLQHFLRDPRLVFEMMGIEDLPNFPEFFDLVLCMGVIYHRRSPLETLIQVKNALRPGGIAIIENLVIPGEEPVALCVAERYARMHNIYFIPTVSGLEAWLKKAGFAEIETFDCTKVTQEEQRKTPYAPFQSLEDFLDPDDQQKTVEGYPAPMRVCLRARKR